MSALQDFQKAHGETFSKLKRSPAFQAAFHVLNLDKIESIIALSDDEIRENGAIILADLRGHLKHENLLLTLDEQKTLDMSDLPEEDYISPEEEIRRESKRGRPKKKTK